MKIKILLIFLTALFISCKKDNASGTGGCTYNGNTLYDGPKGGCYYINSNNNKTYVDRSYCYCK